jgi:hypothetical protein
MLIRLYKGHRVEVDEFGFFNIWFYFEFIGCVATIDDALLVIDKGVN